MKMFRDDDGSLGFEVEFQRSFEDFLADDVLEHSEDAAS
jgi:hypothetical protein